MSSEGSDDSGAGGMRYLFAVVFALVAVGCAAEAAVLRHLQRFRYTVHHFFRWHYEFDFRFAALLAMALAALALCPALCGLSVAGLLPLLFHLGSFLSFAALFCTWLDCLRMVLRRPEPPERLQVAALLAMAADAAGFALVFAGFLVAGRPAAPLLAALAIVHLVLLVLMAVGPLLTLLCAKKLRDKDRLVEGDAETARDVRQFLRDAKKLGIVVLCAAATQVFVVLLSIDSIVVHLMLLCVIVIEAYFCLMTTETEGKKLALPDGEPKTNTLDNTLLEEAL